MATPREWADPFLEQAREDLRAAWAVSTAGGSPSTLCMLIQMVFEKLAKAAYARSGQVVPKTHQIVAYLFNILLRDPVGKSLLQDNPNVQQFVEALENAQPSIAGKQAPVWPQLEYPWEDTSSGAVHYPARHLWLVRRVEDPKDRIVADCLIVASALEKQLTTIVP